MVNTVVTDTEKIIIWNCFFEKGFAMFPIDIFACCFVYANRQCTWKTLGGTLGISGWGCAAGTLEPLTYARASSAEFCYPVLE